MQDVIQFTGYMNKFSDIVVVKLKFFYAEQMFDIPQPPVIRLSIPIT